MSFYESRADEYDLTKLALLNYSKKVKRQNKNSLPSHSLCPLAANSVEKIMRNKESVPHMRDAFL
jgi:hypothetical protein